MKEQLVECLECGRYFKKITNTHLWKEHQMTEEEYLGKHPAAILTPQWLKDKYQEHKQGKTYAEIYGLERSKYLQKQKSEHATKQWKQHWKVKALEHYGNECMRCGKVLPIEQLHLHHKDLVNVEGSPWNDNSLDNLEVLCTSCHSKYHQTLKRTNTKFVGIANVEKGVHYILKGLQQAYGIDIKDVNFKDTPKRVARAYAEICEGAADTSTQIKEILATSFPAEGYNQMIVCKDVKTFGLCPHHLLPVEYTFHVGYIPNNSVLGVSKLARIADIWSKQPKIQETVTQQIGETLCEIKPKGVIVVGKGIHYCMRMRGIKQANTAVTTSFVKGVFYDEDTAKQEFYNNLRI
jgi:GTP cyclohydrolase IA